MNGMFRITGTWGHQYPALFVPDTVPGGGQSHPVPLSSLTRTWDIPIGSILGLTLHQHLHTALQSCGFISEEAFSLSSTAQQYHQDRCCPSQSPRQQVREVDSSVGLE